MCVMKWLYLRGSYFDEEAAAFVWDLEDFGPWKTIDPQFVFVNHQTTGANPQHDVNTIQILTETRRKTEQKIKDQMSTKYADFRELWPSEETEPSWAEPLMDPTSEWAAVTFHNKHLLVCVLHIDTQLMSVSTFVTSNWILFLSSCFC